MRGSEGAERAARVLGAALLCAGLLVGAEVSAHGIWGHVHVTGWAIENLPEGELRDFFSDPEVVNAALFGAAFTDSGYWPQGGDLSRRSRAYGEHTHWEPFIADFIAWIVANDPPPWDDQESRKRVAFLMGCASHGLQDEIFDSLFLYQVEAHDTKGQDEADPATDGFLALDGHIRFAPTEYIPMDTLVELYARLDQDVDAETILSSVSIMKRFYLNHEVGIDVARALGDRHAPELPWTREHYLDPEIPGSLRAEVFHTMRYLQALWKRLHGDLGPADLVVFAYPEAPRRLLGPDAAPDNWATLIFGAGLRYDQTAPTWVDDQGDPVAFARNNTRWGEAWPRLIRLQPEGPLVPGGWYTVGLDAGAAVIDGFEMDTPFALRFQVACGPENPDDCEDLGDIPVAAIDPTPSEEPDAGLPDADDGEPDPPPSLPQSQPADGGCATPLAAPHSTAAGWLLLCALIGARARRRDRGGCGEGRRGA